jgi:hypothetical protein
MGHTNLASCLRTGISSISCILSRFISDSVCGVVYFIFFWEIWMSHATAGFVMANTGEVHSLPSLVPYDSYRRRFRSQTLHCATANSSCLCGLSMPHTHPWYVSAIPCRRLVISWKYTVLKTDQIHYLENARGNSWVAGLQAPYLFVSWVTPHLPPQHLRSLSVSRYTVPVTERYLLCCIHVT